MAVSDRGITCVAIVGCGVIGASGAAFYLAHGFDVVATDPAPDAETRLRDLVEMGRASAGHKGQASRD
jgi:carnitine 3-dehydrogenase